MGVYDFPSVGYYLLRNKVDIESGLRCGKPITFFCSQEAVKDIIDFLFENLDDVCLCDCKFEIDFLTEPFAPSPTKKICKFSILP